MLTTVVAARRKQRLDSELFVATYCLPSSIATSWRHIIVAYSSSLLPHPHCPICLVLHHPSTSQPCQNGVPNPLVHGLARAPWSAMGRWRPWRRRGRGRGHVRIKLWHTWFNRNNMLLYEPNKLKLWQWPHLAIPRAWPLGRGANLWDPKKHNEEDLALFAATLCPGAPWRRVMPSEHSSPPQLALPKPLAMPRPRLLLEVFTFLWSGSGSWEG